MTELKKIPGKLTVGEALERLKQNPNDPDPELQRFKKSMESFYANFAPKIIEINQFSKAAIEAIRPSLKLSTALAAAIKPPPPYIFESIRRMNEDFQRLSEPMKVLADTIAKFQAPLIYPVLPRVEYETPTIIEEPQYESPKPVKTYQEELLEEQNDLLRQVINRLQKEEPKIKGKPFFFDDVSRTFMVREVNWRALNLSTERGKEQMSLFFVCLLEFLKANGKMNEQILQAPILMGELIKKLKLKGITASRDWVYSTKSNLKNKKIIPSKLEKVIIITEHVDEIDGFYFGIKLPLDDLDLS